MKSEFGKENIQMKEKILEIFVCLIFIGIITGILPMIGLLLIEKYKILFIVTVIFDICWIGKEIKNWIYEG